jgi:hypothetical protein
MATVIPFLVSRVIDAYGRFVPGAKLYSYIAGTTTPTPLYSDAAGTIPHANPVIADSGGVFPVVYAKAESYKLAVKTAADVAVVPEIDNFVVPEEAGGVVAFPTAIKTANYTVTSNDRGAVLLVDASGAPGQNVVVSADSATLGNGFPIWIVNTGSAGTVTIQGTGAQTVDGAANLTLPSQNSGAGITSTGAAGWRVFSQTGGLFLGAVTLGSSITVAGFATFNETVTMTDDIITPPVAMADGATITPDLNAGSVLTVTIAGNRTMAAPTNELAGQRGLIHIIQDGTGNRTITWNAAWKFQNGFPERPDPTANATTVYEFYVRGTDDVIIKRFYSSGSTGIGVYKTYTLAATVASNTTYTQAHGLGRYPSLVTAAYENVNAVGGWSVGQRVDLNSLADGAANNTRPQLSYDATNIYVHTATAGLGVIKNFSTRTEFAATGSDWLLTATVYE